MENKIKDTKVPWYIKLPDGRIYVTESYTTPTYKFNKDNKTKYWFEFFLDKSNL